jgi:hypothetical protein
LLKVLYYESGEYKLVNKRDGSETKLWGLPILSPDKKMLISYSNALGYDVMPNGIQFFKMENGKLNLVWECEIEDWTPDYVNWVDNTSIIIKKKIPKEFSEKTHDLIEYFKLKI